MLAVSAVEKQRDKYCTCTRIESGIPVGFEVSMKPLSDTRFGTHVFEVLNVMAVDQRVSPQHVAPFEHERGQAGPGQVGRAGQPVVSTTDDDGVIALRHLLPPESPGIEASGCHVAAEAP